MPDESSGALADRVAIITGAGRGVGRQHALLFAREGAKVVVNDVGRTTLDGVEVPTAEVVAREIRDLGGDAVASTDDSSHWDGAKRLVDTAVEAFGELSALVNNAGLTRHGAFTEMTEEAWDRVLAVNLKSPFLTMRHAGAYWRGRHEAGRPVEASVVNTTSRGALYARADHLFVGYDGMLNYGVAKAGVATLGEIAARELRPFGVRVNTISPSARGMLSPAMERIPVPEGDVFDEWDPANISPLVAWLSTADCPVSGQTFWIKGDTVSIFQSWHIVDALKTDGRWTLPALDKHVDRLSYRTPEDIAGT